MTKGHVTLVGAGPGDPGLITLRGVKALESADVILYDHLSANDLLQHAPDHAERIYVGKQPGLHSLKQEEINQLLIDLAQQGKQVVRLKGGDPFVFGRGGEEGLALNRAGLSFDIIPGISSAFGVPAYAGIPVSHRGLASSLAVVTGHESPTKEQSALDWDALARIDTLIVLMGVGNLENIVLRLQTAGRDKETPVALIEWGTLGRQRTVTGTLETIVAQVRAARLQAPAIIVIGNVVRLRDSLNWFETLPLQGLRVLVTRTRQQTGKLSLALRALGAEPVECPLIEIVSPSDWAPLDEAIHRLMTYRWVIWTSNNGVAFFFRRLARAGLDARALAGCRLAAIGKTTAAALEQHGLRADLVPKVHTAESLAQALSSADTLAGQAVLVPHSGIARQELVDLLQQQGANVDQVSAYLTVQPEGVKAELEQALSDVDVVTFTSSSSVQHLVEALGSGMKHALQGRALACIGPITASTLRGFGYEPAVVADEYTIEGLVKALVTWNRQR